MKSSVPWFWQRAYPPPRCNCITNQYSCHIKGLTQTYFCNTTQNTTSLYIFVFEQLIDKIQSISNFNPGVQVYCFVTGESNYGWLICHYSVQFLCTWLSVNVLSFLRTKVKCVMFCVTMRKHGNTRDVMNYQNSRMPYFCKTL